MRNRGYFDRFKTVQLFGTILENDDYGGLFAPEDQVERAFWVSWNVGKWEKDGDVPGQGVMSMPYWIARKRLCLGPELEDDDPAWLIHIARLPRKYFAARWIKVVENPPKS